MPLCSKNPTLKYASQTKGSVTLFDPKAKSTCKNHLYWVRHDQGQILAPILGRYAGATLDCQINVPGPN